MRVNSEEALRRGREALDKAGSWMELRKTAAVGSFSSLSARRNSKPKEPSSPKPSSR